MRKSSIMTWRSALSACCSRPNLSAAATHFVCLCTMASKVCDKQEVPKEQGKGSNQRRQSIKANPSASSNEDSTSSTATKKTSHSTATKSSNAAFSVDKAKQRGNDNNISSRMALVERINKSSVVCVHPLRYVWVFWHYRRSKGTNKCWMDCQRKVAEMDSLEAFWNFFLQLEAPSVAKINQDYSLFKRGIAPMWEDPANLKGGQWIFVIQKSAESYRQQVDHIWQEIVLALVGAIFSPPIMELVCGVVFSMRISCYTKISVWVRDVTAVKELLVLGHELKRLTAFEDCIIFRRNDDMMVKFIL